MHFTTQQPAPMIAAHDSALMRCHSAPWTLAATPMAPSNLLPALGLIKIELVLLAQVALLGVLRRQTIRT